MGPRLCKSNKRHITLLMIGLDNAGKTSTTKHLLRESPEDVVPTVGFSSVQLERTRFRVTLYDLGGGARIRSIWSNYYALAHGVVVVVDASAADRAEECRQAVSEVLGDPRISGKPVLVLLNKQDIENVVDEIEMCSLLDLENIVNQFKCPTRVETSCAIRFKNRKRKKDPGIDKGFQWILDHISRNFQDLQSRVEADTELQRLREAREQEERLKRVQKAREDRAKAANTGQRTSIEEDDRNGNKMTDLNYDHEKAEARESDFTQRSAEEVEKTEERIDTPDGAVIINVHPAQREESSNSSKTRSSSAILYNKGYERADFVSEPSKTHLTQVDT
ncbi:unnamed protein product [Ixodes pacificus]